MTILTRMRASLTLATRTVAGAAKHVHMLAVHPRSGIQGAPVRRMSSPVVEQQRGKPPPATVISSQRTGLTAKLWQVAPPSAVLHRLCVGCVPEVCPAFIGRQHSVIVCLSLICLTLGNATTPDAIRQAEVQKQCHRAAVHDGREVAPGFVPGS